jgi:hypothetical protein
VLIILTALSTEENGKTDCVTEKEYRLGKKVIATRDNGNLASALAMAPMCGLTDIVMLVIMKTTNVTDLEFSNGQISESIADTTKMIKEMVKENSCKKSIFHHNNLCSWPNGDRYIGNYENSNRNGEGVFYWADGRKYEGGWKDGSYHGYGVYTHRDGCQYKGQWRENMRYVTHHYIRNCSRNGHGRFIWPDGDNFEGEWIEGKRRGKGKFYKPGADGPVIIDQEWQEDKFNKHNKGLPGVDYSCEKKRKANGEPDEEDSSPIQTKRLCNSGIEKS